MLTYKKGATYYYVYTDGKVSTRYVTRQAVRFPKHPSLVHDIKGYIVQSRAGLLWRALMYDPETGELSQVMTSRSRFAAAAHLALL